MVVVVICLLFFLFGQTYFYYSYQCERSGRKWMDEKPGGDCYEN